MNARTPMVFSNDYRSLPVAQPDQLEPSLSLTVIVPVRDSGDGAAAGKLSLVLASLASSSYPQDLLSVIVVDDGSPSPLSLPSLAPVSTSLLRLEDDGPLWGKSRAFNAALDLVSSELVMSLDADMLLHPDHLSLMARWPQVCPTAVVLGYKRIVTEWQSDPAVVASLLADGGFEECASGPGEPHAWFEDEVAATDMLTERPWEAFKVFVGATVMMRTGLLRAAGGYDIDMRLAEDTELGYRLGAAGAVFVPEPLARSWHLGLTSMAEHRDEILPHNHALLAPRVPAISYLRKNRAAQQFKVPHVHVNVFADEDCADEARALIDSLLAGAMGVDVRVRVVGEPVDQGRYRAVGDAHAGLRRLANAFAFDARVEFASTPARSVFPCVYLIDAPGYASARSLRLLLEQLRSREVAVVAVAGEPLVEHGSLVAYRQAALARVEAYDGSLPVSRLDVIARAADAGGLWWMAASSLRLGAKPGPVPSSVPAHRRVSRRVRRALKWRLAKLSAKL